MGRRAKYKPAKGPRSNPKFPVGTLVRVKGDLPPRAAHAAPLVGRVGVVRTSVRHEVSVSYPGEARKWLSWVGLLEEIKPAAVRAA